VGVQLLARGPSLAVPFTPPYGMVGAVGFPKAKQITLVTGCREMWLDGVLVAAFGRSRLQFAFLVAIATRGHELNRRELYEQVWDLPYRKSSNNPVNVAAARLREALRDSPIEVETSASGSYGLKGLFDVQVRRVLSTSSAEVVRDLDVPSTEGPELLMPADLPVVFDRYLLQAILGDQVDARQGTTRVFRAQLIGPGGFRKTVALKVFGVAENASAAQPLINEALIGGLLKHRNIVETYDFGEFDGRFYVAMEWVEGCGLRAFLEPGVPVPLPALLEIGGGICAGLAHAHGLLAGQATRCVVHRNVNPSNVFMSTTGVVKLTDFGAARTTVASAPYLSPEQHEGLPLDGRSDIFSVGVLLYRLAVGRPLFQGSTVEEIREAVLSVDLLIANDEVLAPVEAVGTGLANVVRQCLWRSPERRPPSALEVGQALGAMASGQPAGLGVADLVPLPVATLVQRSIDPVPVPASRRTNLGTEPNRFVGRRRELEELADQFNSGSRLVTVTGPGGTGKTRLARRFGALRSGLAGGVWFCDLAEVRSVDGILRAVAQALGVPLTSDLAPEFVASKLGYAIAGRGDAMLILDNFEQVVAHAPETIGAWLECAPSARLLVTSRERSRLSGESIVALSPLGQDDAVELFFERAGRARPAEIGAADLAVVSEIVSLLDGIPLAVELAAARVGVLTPAALLNRLRDGQLEPLGRGPIGAAARHANLRAAIDWSWNLLEPWERDCLAQCSVFQGGFFLDAVEGVVDVSGHSDAPWVVFIIEALLDKSLLHSYRPPSAPDRIRFGLYESIREFVAERLARSEEAGTRHATWFAAFGNEDAMDALSMSGGTQRLAALALEYDNLTAVVERSLARGDGGVAAGACRAAMEVVALRGPLFIATTLAERVLDEARDLHPRARLRLLVSKGRALNRAGQVHGAGEAFEMALEMARELGDRRFEGVALGALGFDHRSNEEEASLCAALAIAREVGDRVLEGESLSRLGTWYLAQGQIDDALAQFERALSVDRDVGNRRDEGLVYTNLGKLYSETGRLGQATSCYTEALAIHREVGDRWGESIALANLAVSRLDRGLRLQALQDFESVLTLCREIGARAQEGLTLGNLGLLHSEEGRTEEARHSFESALAILRDMGGRDQQAITLLNLGDLCLAEGRFEEAGRHLNDALSLAIDVGIASLEGAVLGSLAELGMQADDDLVVARRRVARGELLLRRAGHRIELAKLLSRRGRVDLRVGDRDAALSALAECEELCAALDVVSGSALDRELVRLREALHDASAG